MQRFTGERKRKMLWMLAVLAPIATVQAVRLFEAAGGPASAAAQQSPSTDAPSPLADSTAASITPARPLTPAQVRALEFVRSLRRDRAARSPMDGHEPDPPIVTCELPRPPVNVEITEFPAEISVTAVIGAGDSAAAYISHRLRRVGDEIAPGWIVEEIDARNRRVTVAHRDGRTQVLQPPTALDGPVRR